MTEPDTHSPSACFSVGRFAQQFFQTHSASAQYLIAYSGGLDSHVLLHLFSHLQPLYPDLTVRSIYVDHGLQQASANWAKHCQSIADQLGVEHQTLRLQLSKKAGDSLEAIARKARYEALASHLKPGEVLLTAHHQNDQAETLLLQLLRGAGLDGLAAMPETQPFGSGFHTRPLLSYKKNELEDYAKHTRLDYITDPTNRDNRFDRNFLRNNIIPQLKKRWPALDTTLSRAARFQAEASELLADYIEAEMATATGSSPGLLSANAVNALSDLKKKALIRQWIKQSGFPPPSEIKLRHIIQDIFQSKPASNPLVQWQGAEIRRFRDDVYIMPPLADITAFKQAQPISWDVKSPLGIPGWGQLKPDDLGVLKPFLQTHADAVRVRFRRGGERLRPAGRKHSLSLKNLLQEANIPPWQRERLPLIYVNVATKITGKSPIINETLVCVPTVACIDLDELVKLK